MASKYTQVIKKTKGNVIQQIINGSGSLAKVSGNFITSNTSYPKKVAQLKVIAIGEDGSELENYTIPTGTSINLEIHLNDSAARIETAKVGDGNISIFNPGNIGSIMVEDGNVVITDIRGSIDSIKVEDGDVKIRNCPTISKIKIEDGKVIYQYKSKPKN
jgi:hypothetical protein